MTDGFGSEDVPDGRDDRADAIPDFVAARDHALDELVRFVRALRRAGVNVPANAGTTAARALVEVGFDNRERAAVALRACLVTERDDMETFETLFADFWWRLTAGLGLGGPASRPENGPEGGPTPLVAETTSSDRHERTDPPGEEADTDDRRGLGATVSHGTASAPGDEPTTTALYSPTGRRTDISTSDVGSETFAEAFDDLTRALAGLPGRRWRTGGDVADVRRALRTSVSTGGTVVALPRRERTRSAVRALVLVDVSRSVLDVVDRGFLVEFLRLARATWRDTQVFFFDDDLREVTSSFDAGSPRAALDALERAETDWGGGTHIGGSLLRLRREFHDAVDRRSVVIVVSDGLEMGDVSDLEQAMSWLSRRSTATLWLNPLAASVEYEPTARGMAAALPYLDGLFAFAGPDDVVEMATQLRRRGPGGRVGYEYDSRREHA